MSLFQKAKCVALSLKLFQTVKLQSAQVLGFSCIAAIMRQAEKTLHVTNRLSSPLLQRIDLAWASVCLRTNRTCISASIGRLYPRGLGSFFCHGQIDPVKIACFRFASVHSCALKDHLRTPVIGSIFGLLSSGWC